MQTKPEMNGVNTQPTAIDKSTLQRMFLLPVKSPIPITAPITA